MSQEELTHTSPQREAGKTFPKTGKIVMQCAWMELTLAGNHRDHGLVSYLEGNHGTQRGRQEGQLWLRQLLKMSALVSTPSAAETHFLIRIINCSVSTNMMNGKG